jgi:hypothetical protein
MSKLQAIERALVTLVIKIHRSQFTLLVRRGLQLAQLFVKPAIHSPFFQVPLLSDFYKNYPAWKWWQEKKFSPRSR